MKKSVNWKGTYLEKAAAILVAIGIWQILSLLIHQRVLLASPIEVLRALGIFVLDKKCLLSVILSVGHFVLGFLLAFSIGIMLAFLSARYHGFEVFLWPYMQTVKATPVASFIILCLVWFPVQQLSVIISFLMVVPIVYHNFLAGIRMLDRGKTEMCKVYGIPFRLRFFAYILPQLKAAVVASCSTGLAMAFKAGTAAEVIGTPAYSIGRMLYQAKIYLCTADLMAWTVVIVACSVLLEKLLLSAVKVLYNRLEKICMRM